MSVEQELKLHIAAASRQAVEELLHSAAAETIHLHALYFDTEDRALARAGIALRLRKEADTWVQTIKLPGEDALSKIELNHLRPDATLDISVYEGTPAESTFRRLNADLIVRFETDIQRTLRTQSTGHGTVELAYDVGVIRSAALELPVYELELELKSGASAAIFELAESWQQDDQFILDFRSKAERGDALADLAIAQKALSQQQTQDLDLGGAFEHFKLWQPAAIISSGNQFYTQTSEPQLKKDSQQYLELIARNAAVMAAIDRKDMVTAIDLNCAAHLEALCRTLDQLHQLWSNPIEPNATDKVDAAPATSSLQAMRQTLSDYQQAFSALSLAAPKAKHPSEPGIEQSAQNLYADLEPQEAQQQANALAASSDFQQWLLKVLAWTILN